MLAWVGKAHLGMCNTLCTAVGDAIPMMSSSSSSSSPSSFTITSRTRSSNSARPVLWMGSKDLPAWSQNCLNIEMQPVLPYLGKKMKFSTKTTFVSLGFPAFQIWQGGSRTVAAGINQFSNRRTHNVHTHDGRVHPRTALLSIGGHTFFHETPPTNPPTREV